MKRTHPKPLYWNKDFSGFFTKPFTKVSMFLGLSNIYSVCHFITSTAKTIFLQKIFR